VALLPACRSSLPAAATTTTLRRSANSTADRSAGMSSAVASDKLMTPAPSRTASLIACGVTAVGNVSELLILMDRIRAAGATPVNETPASGAAAMMLAIEVPWPTQSAFRETPEPVPDPAGSAAARSGPMMTRRPNCGLASTPLSTTATVTPAPVVRSQTEENRSARWAHGAPAGAAVPYSEGQPGRGPGRLAGAAGSGAGRGAASAAGPDHNSPAAQAAAMSGRPSRATATSSACGDIPMTTEAARPGLTVPGNYYRRITGARGLSLGRGRAVDGGGGQCPRPPGKIAGLMIMSLDDQHPGEPCPFAMATAALVPGSDPEYIFRSRPG